MFKLGQYAGEHMQMIKFFDNAAADGHVEAMNALGMAYHNREEYRQAAEWFKKASEKGYTRALNNLGICYELGQGVKEDIDEAQRLYTEGAEKGHVNSMYNSAFLSLQVGLKGREGADARFKKAALWFRKCLLKCDAVSKQRERGNFSQFLNLDQGANVDLFMDSSFDQVAKIKSNCLYHLGQLHEAGLGCDKDLQSAVRFYQQSTKALENEKALSKLGDYYYSKGDKENAMKCYERAYGLGDLAALNNIALMQEQGYGKEGPDAKKATRTYELAIDNGNGDAAVNLALLLIKVSMTHINQL